MLARGRFAGHARIAVSGGIESSGVFDASKRSAQDTRDAHHLARRQVGDGDERLSHQLFRLVIGVDATEQLDVACRIVQTLSFKFRLADGCCLSGLPFL